uniref:Capsid protein n=1 Tax=Foveavirus mali TaxID=35350 RepID=A0A8K1J717_9VIRU|nr:coat protein [Apple stem pitting virus]
MASSGDNSQSSTPMVSVEENSLVTSSPNPSVVASLPVSMPVATSISTEGTMPAASEAVVSQVQSVAPIVSGFDPNLHGRLTNEQHRVAQEEAARRGFLNGVQQRRQIPATSAYAITSNPFETGNAYGEATPVNMGPYPTFQGQEQASEPSSQRIFPIAHGVNPSAHDSTLRPQTEMSQSVAITPFTLGNRAPRTASSISGGMRRRLDSVGLKSIIYEPQAGVVASDQKIRAIGMALVGMGIGEHQLTEVGVYLARHCADVGASDKSTLLGTFPGSNITLEEVGTMIKQTEGCTLRQYCAFYAKHVWNLMLQTQSPPANWVGKEFKFETRYAAFDFFFGVESTASLEPADGLIRLPTQAERVANATSKEIQMYRIRSMEGTQAVNFGEVTGGKVGPKPVLSIRK